MLTTYEQDHGSDDQAFVKHMEQYLQGKFPYLRQMHDRFASLGIGTAEQFRRGAAYMAQYPNCSFYELEAAMLHYGSVEVNRQPDGTGNDISNEAPTFSPADVQRIRAAREVFRQKLVAESFEDDKMPPAIKDLIGSRRKLARVNEYLAEFPGCNYQDAEAYANSDSKTPTSWQKWGR
jgi:hypothetical protein